MEEFPDSIEDLRKQLDEKSLELEQMKRELEFDASLEAALERVRSLSLKMSKSEELFDVIQLIMDQFFLLKINVESAALALNPDSDDLDCWTAVPGALYPFKVFIPYFDHAVFNLTKDAKNKGLDSVSYCLPFEEKNLWLDHIYKHLLGVPEERKKHNYSSPGYTLASALRKNFDLNIFNYSGVPYSAVDLEVLKRFGNVFEQAYSRFLDLKKAESNAVRLQELDTFKSRLYTNITHEFRTPLTVILGMAQQTLEKPKEYLQEGMKLIIRNGQNLLDLVNQMLDLSKLESGNLSLHYQQGDVVNFVEYILESLHSLAQSKGIQMHFLSDVEALTMDIDETRLQQVVSNLLSNAVKFTPRGGNIYLSLSIGAHTDYIQHKALVLKVKDTGIGIAAEDLPYIFDRFYQVDDSLTRHGEGTGIGLSLTKELVKLMEGNITAQSLLGEGTEFIVTLPIRQLSGVPEGIPVEKERKQEVFQAAVKEISGTAVMEDYPMRMDEQTTASEKPLVLIADDNADVRAYIASCLAQNYQLLIAKDGQECENIAFEKTPDLIVSDVMMPFKDGYGVLETLKNDERTSHIPIILLTAKADAQSRLAGLRRGADAYLAKPFQKEELLVTIENLLQLRRKLQLKYQQNILAAEVAAPTESAADPEDAFLQNVRALLAANYTDETFGTPQLCQKIGLSRSQLFRKMKALTDIAPSDLIRSYRLNKAKMLLESGAVNVAEAAWEVGFKDPSYFSKLYHEAFGMPPSAVRR